jgi:hypothetical protein
MAYTLANPGATIAGKDPLPDGADEPRDVDLDTGTPSAGIYFGVFRCACKTQRAEIELK